MAALLAVAMTAGCSALQTVTGEGPSEDEFLATADAYLTALSRGDLDGAWQHACQDGYYAPSRAEFDAHLGDMPAPTVWQLSWQAGERNAAGGSRPGRGGGTPSGAAGQVTLADGTTGQVLLWYERAGGICRVSSPDQDPLADALRPADR